MADNRNLKTGFIEHNGARLYFESIGAGPVAVLLHAGITDMRLFDHSITALQDAGYTVLRYDLRGIVSAIPIMEIQSERAGRFQVVRT